MSITARDDLAARLSEHDWAEPNVVNWQCKCGVDIGTLQYNEAIAAHQADVALAWFQERTREAQARAWDKGYGRGRKDAEDWRVRISGVDNKTSRNPYRAEEA